MRYAILHTALAMQDFHHFAMQDSDHLAMQDSISLEVALEVAFTLEDTFTHEDSHFGCVRATYSNSPPY